MLKHLIHKYKIKICMILIVKKYNFFFFSVKYEDETFPFKLQNNFRIYYRFYLSQNRFNLYTCTSVKE